MLTCLDDAERDGVHTDPAGGVLDRQRAGYGHQSAFSQGGKRGWSVAVGVVDEARGDIHDMAAALVDHPRDRQLGDVKEPGQIYARDRGEVGERVLREGLTEVDPGV